MPITPTRKLTAAVTVVGLMSAAGAVASAGASGGRNSPSARDRTTHIQRRAVAPIGNGVAIQAVFDKAGNPDLVANFTPDGSLAKPSWSICPPPDVRVCTPAGNGSQFLTAGPSPAGTVFEATASYNGQLYSARSAPWQGTVTATSPPHLSGMAKYGAAVTPEGASWGGGWGSEFDFLSVEACRTRAAAHCVNLSEPKDYGFSSRPAVVGAWFTGWYLFAFDQRFAHDTAFAQPGYGSAAAVPPVKDGPTVARSAPVGPVTGPAPPRVRILRTASISAGKVFVARVRCSVRCHVVLEVTDNHSGSGARVALAGSGLMGVPRRQLRRGPLGVTLTVDTGPSVKGKTRLQ